jgi:transglutaminase-like putative cysteine protease
MSRGVSFVPLTGKADMTNTAVTLQQYQDRPLNILPVLIAQQLALLPLYFYIPLWISAISLVVTGTVYVAQIKGQWAIPTWLKVAITVAVAAGVLLSFQRLSGRDAGVALIAVMYALKIIEVKSHRDIYVLMNLGFFIVLAGFLFNQSPLIAAYQFLPVAAILNALTANHSLTQTNRVMHRSFGQTVRQLSKYLVLALPLMVVLFIFFPRLSGPIWKMPGGSSATSGISDTMSPGAISNLQLFDKVAFRVKFDGEAPMGNDLYWRTLVLDEFDGLTWSRHFSRFEKPIKSQFDLQKQAKENSNETLDDDRAYQYGPDFFRYDISLEATKHRWLTLLDTPVDIPKRARLFSDYSARLDHRLIDRTRYSGVSNIRLPLDLDLSDSDRNKMTKIPLQGNPRAKQWAIEARAASVDDRDYIMSVLKRINRQEYFYTLSPPIMQQDIIDSFWFDEQMGFCEHYAGTLVYLARAAGVPARVVVGYQGAEKNPLSDYWIVRYANAHAWTEVWFSGEGWVRIDPTSAIAPHRVEQQLQLDYNQRDSLFDDFAFGAVDLADIGWYKEFQYWMDKANTGWNDWVLDYSQGSQRKLFKGLGLENFSAKQVTFLMISILAVFLLVMGFKWVKQTKRIDPIEQSFDIITRKLNKAKFQIGSKTGVSAFLRDLSLNDEQRAASSTTPELTPASLESLKRVLERYVFLRYKTNKITEKQQKDFRRQVKALRIRPL